MGDRLHDRLRPLGREPWILSPGGTIFDPFRKEADAFRVLAWVVAVVAAIVVLVLVVRALT